MSSLPVDRTARAVAAASTIRTVTAREWPALGMADLNVAAVAVSLEAGAHHVPHTHPRAAEVLTLSAGTLAVWFVEENGHPDAPPRLLRNVLAGSGAAFIPRGLIHGAACVGVARCAYVSVLASGDPGVVSVGPRFCNAPPADVAAALGIPQADAETVCEGVVPTFATGQPAQ